MDLASVTLLDCIPAGVIRPDLGSRTELVASRDSVTLQLKDGYILVDFHIGIPLARVVRFKGAVQP